MRGGAGFLILLLALAPPAAAQAIGPPGPFVVDLRGTMAGLPDGGGFLPPVPSTTVIPARGFGFDAGGHVYPIGFKRVRFGVGVSMLRARGTASPVKVPAPKAGSSSSSTSPKAPATPMPDIATTFSGWAPQVSLNFGNHDGWSYLSAGVGQARIRTVATLSAFSDERTIDQVRTMNFGGGARWFASPHVAFGFDVRFYKLAQTTATVPGPATAIVNGVTVPAPATSLTVTTPKTSLMVISVGVSVR